LNFCKEAESHVLVSLGISNARFQISNWVNKICNLQPVIPWAGAALSTTRPLVPLGRDPR
jgi:hypothetical protein